MNLQFRARMPCMVRLWNLLSPRWKHLQTSGRAEPSINTLGSYLPLGVTPLAVSEDQRSQKREEMEGGGLYGLFSVQATEPISRGLQGPAYGHFNPSCHFASGSKKA